MGFLLPCNYIFTWNVTISSLYNFKDYTNRYNFYFLKYYDFFTIEHLPDTSCFLFILLKFTINCFNFFKNIFENDVIACINKTIKLIDINQFDNVLFKIENRKYMIINTLKQFLIMEYNLAQPYLFLQKNENY